jgi:hypothetical protein
MSCSKERGSALIEFVLCIGCIWVPLFLGASQFGMKLIKATQVTEVCRDAGHMYAYGVNFSQSSTQYLVASLAPNIALDPTGQGGSSVLILSTVQYISTAQCQAGGYSSTCPNYGNVVFTNQLVVGNASLHASAFGTPATGLAGAVAPGSPSTNGYLNQASALVQGFPAITLSSANAGQQYAYIAEVWCKSSDLSWFYSGSGWITSTSFF